MLSLYVEYETVWYNRKYQNNNIETQIQALVHFAIY